MTIRLASLAFFLLGVFVTFGTTCAEDAYADKHRTAMQSDPWRAIEFGCEKHVGSASCSATACHGGRRSSLGPNRSIGGEVEAWITRDPHARLGSLVESPQFAAILERLEIIERDSLPAPPGEEKRAKIVNPIVLAECMRCHNPGEATTKYSPEEIATNVPGEARERVAMSCETCHGGAKQWRDVHYQRDFARGGDFHDLKNLVVRGRVCAACHVGDDSRDMHHDMIAAGHPPLRFDLAAYCDRLPKHWDDRKPRRAVAEYELKLWTAGAIASADSSLALVASRIDRSKPEGVAGRTPSQRPEFSERSCTSCHHALRFPPAGEGRELAAVHDTRTGWESITSRLLDLAQEEIVPRNAFRTAAEAKFPELFGRVASEPLAQRLEVLRLDRHPTQMWEFEAQAYAFLTARTQSRYDDSALGRSAPIASALPQALKTWKNAINVSPLEAPPRSPYAQSVNAWELRKNAAELLRENSATP